jgi:uncharacterized membrane protein
MNSQDTQAAGASPASADLQQAKKVTMVVYALQAASFIFGVTLIAAIIVNYIKKEDVQATWLASHFRWQIRTFWFSLLWGVIGLITALLGIGFIILAADAVWLIYRIAKGWLRLSEEKQMYTAVP